MSTYSFGLTMTNIRFIVQMILDIFIMWLVIYYALRIIRSNTRTIQIFKGIILIIVIDVLAKFLGLKTLETVSDVFINWGVLAIIIIFQPEFRSLLERIGKSNAFSRITTMTVNEKEALVDKIVTAVMLLSKDQTGALITIEQSTSLDDFIASGTPMNSDVTAELLTSLFVTSTPLHDGAVIIQGDKIACASAYFPPTSRELPSRFGSRHRAAIGISEISDCVTIVVSEETGTVSITEGGKIIPVDRQQLHDYLTRVICGENTEVHTHKDTSISKKTGILNKLTVKKQIAPISHKIDVEEVNPAKDLDKTMDQIHQEADSEAKAAEIKLPHKKNRPAPSYPKQEERIQPVYVKPEIEEVKEDEYAEMTEVKHPDASSKKTMSAADVEAARQQAMNAYRHTEKTNPDSKFDTSKLDVTKIVGMNNELDDTFRMVDSKFLDDASSKKNEGGENND